MADPTPAIGLDVFYVDPIFDEDTGAILRTKIRSARVTEVMTPYTVHLAIFHPDGLEISKGVNYDDNETPAPMTWHHPIEGV